MIILVSDTSVLIDLERGGLLEAVFSCGLTLVVPDLLYQNELENENGPYLRTLGLGVLSLSPEEMVLAQEMKAKRRALSSPDCFALCCAMRPAHALVTGDKAMRKEANARIGRVHGLLWLLDQMATSGAVETTHLYEGLTRIAGYASCRLPHDEVNARLAAWAPQPPTKDAT